MPGTHRWVQVFSSRGTHSGVREIVTQTTVASRFYTEVWRGKWSILGWGQQGDACLLGSEDHKEDFLFQSIFSKHLTECLKFPCQCHALPPLPSLSSLPFLYAQMRVAAYLMEEGTEEPSPLSGPSFLLCWTWGNSDRFGGILKILFMSLFERAHVCTHTHTCVHTSGAEAEAEEERVFFFF